MWFLICMCLGHKLYQVDEGHDHIFRRKICARCGYKAEAYLVSFHSPTFRQGTQAWAGRHSHNLRGAEMKRSAPANMFDMDKERAKFESRMKLSKAFGILWLLLIVAAGLFGLYIVVSATRHVEKHGLKSVVEEVWSGQEGTSHDR